MLTPRQKGMASVLAAAIIMGSTGVMVRMVSVNEAVITTARMSGGLLFILLYLCVRRRFRVIVAKPSHWVLVSGVTIPLIILSYVRAIQNTSLAVSALLLYTGPPMAVAMSVLFFRERITLKAVGAMALAVAGLLLLLGVRSAETSLSGSVWGALSGVFYALYILANGRIPGHISGEVRTTHQLAAGLITILICTGWRLQMPAAGDWPWLLMVGLLLGAVAIGLMVAALKALSALEYGVLAYIEPLVGALWGMLLFSESLSRFQAAGGALIILSGLMMILPSRIETHTA